MHFHRLRYLIFSTIACSGGCEGFVHSEPSQSDTQSQSATCEFSPGPPPILRLLTRSEYRRSILALFGKDFNAGSTFPAEAIVNGFNNNAATHRATPLLVEEIAAAAQSIAQSLSTDELATLSGCKLDPNQPSDDDSLMMAGCREKLIDNWVPLAFRRPLTETEREIMLELGRRASTLDYDAQIATLIEATLQSPQFLYRQPSRPESPGSESPGPNAESTKSQPLSAYALASRLSFFLQGGPPDARLLELAANKSLRESEVLMTEVTRLLDTPQAVDRIREFHEQWLALDRLKDLVRDELPADSGPVFENALLNFLDAIFWAEEGANDLETLFTRNDLALDDELLDLYAPLIQSNGDDFSEGLGGASAQQEQARAW
ncbi:MAG: DUF1592 domain-containing protein, partial [Polyangiaceae bacterium]|nr:DUF1592 domain-containing protein [Polyangiaceae bacterium]